MISLDSSHGPTMEKPPLLPLAEKERDTGCSPPECAAPRTTSAPGNKEAPSEIRERWAAVCGPPAVKLSWDFIFVLLLVLRWASLPPATPAPLEP